MFEKFHTGHAMVSETITLKSESETESETIASTTLTCSSFISYLIFALNGAGK